MIYDKNNSYNTLYVYSNIFTQRYVCHCGTVAE